MINEKDVEHIARLARLSIDKTEVTAFSEQLSKVLGHIEQLKEVNTDSVEPLLTASLLEANLREDEVFQTLGTEEKLKNAPETSGSLIKVPPVVG